MRRGPLAAGTAVLLSLTALAAWAPGAQAATPLPLPKARAGLPDGRAWERVSPAFKNGARIDALGQVADDGGAMTFSSYGAFSGQTSAPTALYYVGTRTPTGWRTDPVALPPAGPPQPVTLNGPARWSADLRTQIVSSPMALAPGAPDFTVTGPYNGFWLNANLYRRDADGKLTLLSGAEADIPVADRPNFTATVVGATEDLRTVVFSANAALAGAAGSAANLFLTTDGRDIENIGVLPDGTPAPTGSYLAGETQYTPLNHGGTTALTPDLSRIFFQASPNGSDPPQLYARENAGKPGARTVLVSRSQRATPDPLGAVAFRAASADGSKVLFTSVARLTDDAADTTVPENIDGDLYLYDVDRDELTDLTAGHPEGTRLTEFAGAARDLSVAYFIATADLAPGADADAVNLYRWSADGLRLVASGGSDVSHPGVTAGGASVTADGDVLSFSGFADLTGYDTTDPQTGDPHVMRYVYDARRDTIACVSCRPDGRPPTADALFPTVSTATLPKGPRTMTDDGRRIFFESAERLTPGASNRLIKVYEYDRQDGTVAMISGGASPFEDRLGDVSPNGDSVFFNTTQRLVGADDDDLPDMYVARIGGGFPDPPAPDRPCRGDACQGGVAPAPPPPAAGSTAQGAGNVAASDPAGRTRATIKIARPGTARGTHVTLRVTVSGAGRISASGPGIRVTPRTTARRATYALRLALTDRAARTLRTRGSASVKVRVTYAPRGGGASARATVTVRFAHRSSSARRAASTAAEGQGR